MLFRSPEFCRHIGAQPFVSEQQAAAFVDGMITDNNNRKRLYFLIHHNADQKVIGTVGFIFTWGERNRTAEIGYGVSRDYWGKGVFKAAIDELMTWTSVRRIAKLIALTAERNTNSCRALEKYGFTKDGRIDNFYAQADACLIYGYDVPRGH